MRSPLLFVMVLVIPFSTVAVPVAAPTLSKGEVIKLANTAAKKNGYKLVDYEAPQARYKAEGKGGSWYVFYQGKVRRPAGYFYVTVEDRTKATEVWPGE